MSNLSASTLQATHNASIVTDLSSLDAIRKTARGDKFQAIQQAAHEFEAFFLNMMLRSMRSASEAIGESELTSSPQQKMFTSMMDEQLAVDLSRRGSLGIADLLADELARIEGVSVAHHRPPQTIEKPLSITRVKKTPPIGSTKEAQQTQVKALPTNESLQSVNSDSENNSYEDKVTTAPNVAEKKPLFGDVTAFVKSLWPYAKQAARILNKDPKVFIAQAALETGWGRFVMHDEQGRPSYNLFGIKASDSWTGDKIHAPTLEVEDGQFVARKEPFRAYASLREAFIDYIRFLQENPRYQAAVNAQDADEFAQLLQKSGYATDPEYGNKIMRIMRSETLQKLTSDE